MTYKVIAAVLASAISLVTVTQASAEDRRYAQWCDPRDRNCDGRIDRRDRDRDYDGRRDYDDRRRDGRSPTYGSSGSCTFQSSNGPVAGYKPEGKDRCCIETRRGPSCQ
ncbi:MAG TPA: hypothetical protein VJ890_14305 [Vineibacter sp.]|nr:hypothetical protein [Vineibacter sp.]